MAATKDGSLHAARFKDGAAVGQVPVLLDPGFLEVLSSKGFGRALLEDHLAEVSLLRLTLKRGMGSKNWLVGTKPAMLGHLLNNLRS